MTRPRRRRPARVGPDHLADTVTGCAHCPPRKLASLRGRGHLFVHVTDEALRTRTGIARVEGLGPARHHPARRPPRPRRRHRPTRPRPPRPTPHRRLRTPRGHQGPRLDPDRRRRLPLQPPHRHPRRRRLRPQQPLRPHRTTRPDRPPQQRPPPTRTPPLEDPRPLPLPHHRPRQTPLANTPRTHPTSSTTKAPAGSTDDQADIILTAPDGVEIYVPQVTLVLGRTGLSRALQPGEREDDVRMRAARALTVLCTALLLVPGVPAPAQGERMARTWRVGPGRPLATPSAAAAVARRRRHRADRRRHLRRRRRHLDPGRPDPARRRWAGAPAGGRAERPGQGDLGDRRRPHHGRSPRVQRRDRPRPERRRHPPGGRRAHRHPQLVPPQPERHPHRRQPDERHRDPALAVLPQRRRGRLHPQPLRRRGALARPSPAATCGAPTSATS